MTSIISEQHILFPPAPPSEEQENSLQLIHPELLTSNAQESAPQTQHPEESEPETQTAVPDIPRETFNLVNGKFEYIKNTWEREMLVNAWQAITLTENWDFMRQEIYSYMLSNDPRVGIISNKMVELGYDGHSGCSFGCTMRAMQYIAKNGEEKYMIERNK